MQIIADEEQKQTLANRGPGQRSPLYAGVHALKLGCTSYSQQRADGLAGQISPNGDGSTARLKR